MKTSENICEIAKALSAMQASMESATKGSKAHNYKYADLAAVWDSVRVPMTFNGLAIIQDPISSEDGVSVITRILHVSGQWIEFGPLMIPVNKKDAHGTGSAITYAKRYALCAALGIVTEDDDGQAAQKAPPRAQEKKEDLTPITESQHDELEEWIGDNLELRQNILVYMKKKWGIDSLDKMPEMFFELALSRAKAHKVVSEEEKQSA